jgi:hypothetical protein
METKGIDTKLNFKLARVRNTRAIIKNLESYFAELEKTSFPGRMLTGEFFRNQSRIKHERQLLKSLERELIKYRIKMKPKKKV